MSSYTAWCSLPTRAIGRFDMTRWTQAGNKLIASSASLAFPKYAGSNLRKAILTLGMVG